MVTQTAGKMLTVDEFARKVNASQAGVRRWIMQRRINVVRIGRLVRIPPEEARRIVKLGLRPSNREEA